MKNLLYLSFLFFSVLSFGQERTISGNVISAEDGLPLPGASVIIDKTYWKGTQTDLDGNYSLVVQSNDTLVFSFVGMKTQKIRADKDTINVVLQEEEWVKDMDFRLPPPRPQPIRTRAFFVDKNPKRGFKKNAENNTYVIFISELTSYDFSKGDLDFQNKYNVMYSPNFNNFSIEHHKKHNKLTFKHLNKKHNKSWQTEIRKDAIGLDEFLK